MIWAERLKIITLLLLTGSYWQIKHPDVYIPVQNSHYNLHGNNELYGLSNCKNSILLLPSAQNFIFSLKLFLWIYGFVFLLLYFNRGSFWSIY